MKKWSSVIIDDTHNFFNFFKFANSPIGIDDILLWFNFNSFNCVNVSNDRRSIRLMRLLFKFLFELMKWCIIITIRLVTLIDRLLTVFSVHFQWRMSWAQVRESHFDLSPSASDVVLLSMHPMIFHEFHCQPTQVFPN